MNKKSEGPPLLEYDNAYWKRDPVMFRRFYDIVRKYPRNHVQVLSKQPRIRPGCTKISYPKTWDVYRWVNASLPKLVDRRYAMKTKVYWIMNGIVDFPACANKTRGKHTLEGKNVITSTLGYGHHAEQRELYCCGKCKYEDEKFAKAIIDRLHRNFSDPEWYESWYAREYETRRRKYNGKWMDFERLPAAFMSRFGVSNPAKLPEARERGMQTLKSHYGEQYDCAFQVPECKEKARRTLFARTGYRNCMQDPECREKARRTLLKNHGTHSVSSRYVYNGISFDSGWELCFYEYMRDAGRDVMYPSGLSIPYDDAAGNTKFYHPDFIADGRIVEIKGKQFFRPDGTMYCPYKSKSMTGREYEDLCKTFELKRQCMIRNGVQIVTETEMLPILEYIERKHRVGNYMQYCRLFRRSK